MTESIYGNNIMTEETDFDKEETEEIPLEKIPIPETIDKFKKLEQRFEKSIEREEEHYEEYKYFEKRTVKFQDEFPYDRMNWLGKLIMWIICKKRK